MPLDCQAETAPGKKRYGLNDPAITAKIRSNLDIGNNQGKVAAPSRALWKARNGSGFIFITIEDIQQLGDSEQVDDPPVGR